MPYSPPSGDESLFNIMGIYTPPAGNGVDFQFGSVATPALPDPLEIGVSVSQGCVFEGSMPSDLGFQVALSEVDVQKAWVAMPCDLSLGVHLDPVPVTITLVVDAVPDGIGLVLGLSSGEVFSGAIPENFQVCVGVLDVPVEQIYVARGVDLELVVGMSSPVLQLKPDYELPVGVSGGMGIRFGKALEAQVEAIIPFEGAAPCDRKVGVEWRAPAYVGCGIAVPWGRLGLFFAARDASWGAPVRVESGALAGFGILDTIGVHAEFPWGEAPFAERYALSSWLYPPEVNLHHGFPFADVPWVEREAVSPWLIPPEVNRHHATLWGEKHYERICLRAYVPSRGDGCTFHIGHPLSMCGDGDHADFFFDALSYDERCAQREPSGWRENKTFKPVVTVIPGPSVLGVYIVNNNAMLCRLPDRTPIGVLTMSLSSKIDSWCWEFRAVLAFESDLALVRSSDGSPVPVEAEINGWKWVVMVEDYDGSRSFPKGSYTVSGRSLSAELAAPHAPVSTYTQENQRLAQQLAAAELEYTGWTLDWDMTDWLVPGGTFTVSHQTPMETILAIVRAVGGEIQTHRTDKTLRAVSRYPASPWTWLGEMPVISLHESVIITLGWRHERRPGYNGVYVTGSTSGGVNVLVKRDGTAGDVQDQMIVSPLITAVDAGRERGRVALSRAGRWSVQTLSLPLMSGAELPGLLACGDLIEVQETGGNWRGQISDVSVTADRRNGLKVYQNIEVERYYG